MAPVQTNAPALHDFGTRAAEAGIMMLLAVLLAASDPLVEDVLSPRGDALGPGGMRFYALAFTDYALADQGRLDDLARVADAMQHPRFAKHFGEPSVILWGHELLARGAAMLQGDERHRIRARAIAMRLAAAVRPAHLLPSMAHLPRKLWPADNEVGLAALTVAAALFPDEPRIDESRALLKTTLDALGTLPPSELDPKTGNRRPPRGCALGWSVIMRGLHDPEAARERYGRFKQQHWQSYVAVSGFREWPRGMKGPVDLDSGPIILGIGASASAFGMAAAKQVGMASDYATLSRSAKLAMSMSLDAKERESVLARAILRYSETARPWLTNGERR